MKCCVDIQDEHESCLADRERTEERFLEQFAALEDGLSLLQLQMRGLSENAKQFGSLVRNIRQAACPGDSNYKIAIGLNAGYPTDAEVVQSKASYRRLR